MVVNTRKQTQERKRVVTDTIIPDLKIFESAFNQQVLSRFKGYEDKCFQWYLKEIPELQEDLEKLTKWVTPLVDKGIVSRNTALLLLGMNTSDDVNMDIHTVNEDVMTLEDAILPQDNLEM